MARGNKAKSTKEEAVQEQEPNTAETAEATESEDLNSSDNPQNTNGDSENGKPEEELNGAENASEEDGEAAESSDQEPVDPLEAKDMEIAELKGNYLRLMAEFDNFRKRTIREKQQIQEYAAEEVMKKLLPSLDDLDRTLTAMEKTDNLTSIKEGIVIVNEKLKKNLHKIGLHEIKSKGEPFDLELHEAIASHDLGEDKSGIIVEEVEKGYKLKDKVIRYSKVIVGE